MHGEGGTGYSDPKVLRFGEDGTTLPDDHPQPSASRVAPFGHDSIAVASGGCGRRGAGSVFVRTLTSSGHLFRSQELQGAGCVLIAIRGNSRGDLAVLTGRYGMNAHGRLYSISRTLWMRRAGQRGLRPVLPIPVRPGAGEATIALGARGDVMVVWENGPASGEAPMTYARYRSPDGTWLNVERLGFGRDYQYASNDLQAAITGDGRRFALWHPVGHTITIASSTGTQRFAQGRHLRVTAKPTLVLAAPENGDPLLTWVPYAGTPRVLTATITNGVLGRPQAITGPSGAGIPRLADAHVADNGAAVITWTAPRAGRWAPIAATRSTGGQPFGTAQVVSPSGFQTKSAIDRAGTRVYVTFVEGEHANVATTTP